MGLKAGFILFEHPAESFLKLLVVGGAEHHKNLDKMGGGCVEWLLGEVYSALSYEFGRSWMRDFPEQ